MLNTIPKKGEIKILTYYARMLAELGVASIGISAPMLLEVYNKPPNPKIRDLSFSILARPLPLKKGERQTFDWMFKGDKEGLFIGFITSGTRKYVPYTNENILKEMQKQGLVNIKKVWTTDYLL